MLGKVKSWKTGDEVINTSLGEKRNSQTLIWDMMAELGFEELQREGEFWSSVGCDCPLRGQKETTRGWEMDPKKGVSKQSSEYTGWREFVFHPSGVERSPDTWDIWQSTPKAPLQE